MAGPAFRLEGTRGRIVGVGGGEREKAEGRKKRFMLCSSAVLFMERTIPFVCLAITYSAQGHSSRG